MDVTVARIVHVLAVVVWIGGVGFVTTVLMPAVRRGAAPEGRLTAFLAYEERFAWEARIAVSLAALSGLYMTWRLDAWSRFATLHLWWMHAMVALWGVYALTLFVIEPLVLRGRLEEAIAAGASERLFERMERFHQVMFLASLIVIVGAVGGSHGLFY
jgi:uncharacterized membrane protein